MHASALLVAMVMTVCLLQGGVAAPHQESNSSGSKIMFHVTNDGGSEGPYFGNPIMVFPRVVANLGDAYDVNSGKFIAPVAGAYQFNMAINSVIPHPVMAALQKNEKTVAWCWKTETSGQQIDSSSITLLLQPGDQVYVRIIGQTRTHVGPGECSFSGAILFTV